MCEAKGPVKARGQYVETLSEALDTATVMQDLAEITDQISQNEWLHFARNGGIIFSFWPHP